MTRPYKYKSYIYDEVAKENIYAYTVGIWYCNLVASQGLKRHYKKAC